MEFIALPTIPATHVFIGVDVGVSGGIAAVNQDGNVLRACPMPQTDADVLSVLSLLMQQAPAATYRAALERVHSSPQMGVVSAFTFGQGYGGLRMALTASGIPFDEVTPQKWQGALMCRSKGDKNVTKQRAQQLFPSVKITHAIADALLLAEHCRRENRP